MAEKKLPIFFRYRLLWHLLFWVAVFVVYWLIYAGYQERYRQEFFMNLIVLPARMIGTYSLIYLILPMATEKKKFVAFGILVAIHAIFYGFLIYISFYIANPYPEYYDFSQHPIFNLPKILTKSVSDYALPVFAATIVLFKKWYLDEQVRKKLAEEKLEAELNFLKSQIHPHFLFNTLNNLYALTLIKSDQTPDIVLKLSGLLDYMIYNSNVDFVSLSKELEILESYIELEKMRYNERLDLKYEVSGDPESHRIAPLILLPFIENAFKHGASNDRMKPKIRIKIKIDDNCLRLNVVNSITGGTQKEVDLGEGIGLKNVLRRLELIYPESHKLNIERRQETFEVNLLVCWVNE